MKRLFCAALTLLLLLTACGEAPTEAPGTEASSEAGTEATTAPTIAPEDMPIINWSGTQFTSGLTKRGQVMTDAAPVDSNSFSLCGKTYAMPIRISDLIADGWKCSAGDSIKFEAKTRTQLIGYTLTAPDGSRLDAKAIYNDSEEALPMSQTLLVSFWIHDDKVKDTTQLVIPGGICPASTAADVVTVFGRPDSTSVFREHNNGEDTLYYGHPGDLPLEYQFSFDKNGQLYNIDVEYVVE